VRRSPNSDSDPAPRGPGAQVHGFSAWKRLALQPAVLLFKAWGRSLRFEIAEEDRKNLETVGEPLAFVLWHNRLFITAEIVRRYRHGRPIFALVSASRDGAWLDAFFNAAGLRTVRGSSSRLGREAAAALVSVLKEGHDVGITPDGPRGPVYQIKPGALIVSRRTRTTIMLFSAEFQSAWRLRTWDGFYVPWPWSRVRLHCLRVPASELEESDAAALALTARLTAISADALPAPARRSNDGSGRPQA
jgi:lysophospholipid acyltransferase (LPLAT)-like uncharacterized protein